VPKNKLAYFLAHGSPYSCKRSFLSALVCLGLPRRIRKAKAGLWLEILGFVRSRHGNVETRNGGTEERIMKLVIIGGDAAGMSAASRAKRKQPEMEVTVLEQTSDVSYSA